MLRKRGDCAFHPRNVISLRIRTVPFHRGSLGPLLALRVYHFVSHLHESSVLILQECQPEFLHDLVLKMKAYIFTPGDSICRKGEVAREMFIIADGILEVISEIGRVLTTMKAGDFFGEIGILNLDGLNK